jgi:plastocyanin
VNRKLATLIAMLAALALVAAACGGGNDENTAGNTTSTTTATTGGATETTEGGEGGTMTIGSDTANDHGTMDVSGQDEIEIELDDFYFEPTVLQGTAGQELKLELRNEGAALHNFSLDEQSIDQDVQAGEDASVTVTFPDSEFVVFFCKYHRGQGMVGELAVGG